MDIKVRIFRMKANTMNDSIVVLIKSIRFTFPIPLNQSEASSIPGIPLTTFLIVPENFISVIRFKSLSNCSVLTLLDISQFEYIIEPKHSFSSMTLISSRVVLLGLIQLKPHASSRAFSSESDPFSFSTFFTKDTLKTLISEGLPKSIILPPTIIFMR